MGDLKEYKKSAKALMPVGITLSVDARRVHIYGVKGIEYQAVSVIVGGWPTTPHPTLLPGGQGSTAPSYELPDDGTYTFYYLELALEAKLQKEGKSNVTQKQVIERTWYSQEAWEHGGLRIKNEVKNEESPTKKLKKEK